MLLFFFTSRSQPITETCFCIWVMWTRIYLRPLKIIDHFRHIAHIKLIQFSMIIYSDLKISLYVAFYTWTTTHNQLYWLVADRNTNDRALMSIINKHCKKLLGLWLWFQKRIFLRFDFGSLFFFCYTKPVTNLSIDSPFACYGNRLLQSFFFTFIHKFWFLLSLRFTSPDVSLFLTEKFNESDNLTTAPSQLTGFKGCCSYPTRLHIMAPKGHCPHRSGLLMLLIDDGLGANRPKLFFMFHK